MQTCWPRILKTYIETELHVILYHALMRLGCEAVAAVDSFVRARCREYNLLYVNHYTGCPR
ncbi:hypothetical protein [Pyrolobus fumarii]|uniref:hypothetical protein n=1 Tax=Pyrolobus fumarii TaxID=54252 RepID=UPI00143324CC|nr:hypothetical protein [Pyrolobus fumarii]